MGEKPDDKNRFVYERTPVRSEDVNPSREGDRVLSNRKTGSTGPLIDNSKAEGYDKDEQDRHTNSKPS